MGRREVHWLSPEGTAEVYNINHFSRIASRNCSAERQDKFRKRIYAGSCRGQKIRFAALLLASLLGTSTQARTQLKLIPSEEPSRVFGGAARPVSTVWHNAGDTFFHTAISARLNQASSAIAASIKEQFWKELELLPGQTVLESITLDFPLVRRETLFLIQWIESPNHVLGTTEVLVYPPDLLKELGTMAGKKPLGVFDPADRLKPLLKEVKVPVSNFEASSFDNFEPPLAIIGPFESKKQMREDLAASIKLLARKGAAVVWLQPPPERRDPLKPSFYTVCEGNGAVVVAQADLVAKLSDDPQAQLNLIQLCRQALHPEPPRLPDLASQP